MGDIIVKSSVLKPINASAKYYLNTTDEYPILFIISAGKNGVKYEKQTGYCLETQHFPDTPNQPNFPTATISAGQKYHQRTVFTLTNK